MVSQWLHFASVEDFSSHLIIPCRDDRELGDGVSQWQLFASVEDFSGHLIIPAPGDGVLGDVVSQWLCPSHLISVDRTNIDRYIITRAITDTMFFKPSRLFVITVFIRQGDSIMGRRWGLPWHLQTAKT